MTNLVVDKNKPLPFTGLQDTRCLIIYCDDACAFKKRSAKKVQDYKIHEDRRQRRFNQKKSKRK
ncbi:hypothetical protein TSAR_015130 [Trichomalopsis sarcophagae]|uniref:Uncharacterized protein n=1 Tax=Trichomalopsis sarcophagae TaxID=543379 RepID=A0A232EJ36_9HYME|nr:hypothetical protein TSAR_015130 [Trichomalopsis sarcophagae]